MAGQRRLLRGRRPFGPVGLLAPLAPDVALLHAAVADRDGNLALSEPLLEGVWGAWAARRGVVATVERIVDDLDGLGYRVQDPGPPGPGRGRDPLRRPPRRLLRAGPARARLRRGRALLGRGGRRGPHGTSPASPGPTPSGRRTSEAYLKVLGDERLDWLVGRADPQSWRQDADAHPLPADEPVSDWEVAASLGAREVEATGRRALGADAVLAGAGVANLAAWVAVARARADGPPGGASPPSSGCGATPRRRPTPTSSTTGSSRGPRTCPMPRPCSAWWWAGRAPRSSVASGRPRWTATAISTRPSLAGGRFLVGSGGANDVTSRAAACVVITLARPERLPARAAYVTSPGAG